MQIYSDKIVARPVSQNIGYTSLLQNKAAAIEAKEPLLLPIPPLISLGSWSLAKSKTTQETVPKAQRPPAYPVADLFSGIQICPLSLLQQYKNQTITLSQTVKQSFDVYCTNPKYLTLAPE